MSASVVGPLRAYFERIEPGMVLVAHGVFRAAVLTSPLDGWWNPPVLKALALVLLGYDLALAWLLRRGTPPRPWVRWFLTVIELTFWSAAHTPHEPYSGVWALTAPMVTMTTVRRGLPVSAPVAAALVGYAVGVRLLVHADPFPADAVLYAGMYLLGGQCLIALLASEVRRQRRRAAAFWEADVTAAQLDGRNEILAGRGADLIDELQTTIMRLSGSGVDAAVALRGSVARHKLDLARQTRERAMYLRDALDLYAQSVRSSEPSVARHVFFDVDRDAAVCVITAAQADELLSKLRRRGLTGVVPVALSEGDADTAGTALRLVVGDRPLTVAGDRPRVALPLVPAGIALLAMYVARTAVSDSAPVTAAWAFPMAAVTAGYAAVTWMLLRRHGPAVEPWLGLGATVPLALSTAVTTYYAHAGTPRQLTSAGQLLGLAFVLGTITRPRRLVAVAVAVQAAATGVAVAAAPSAALTRAVGDLVWVLAGFVGAHALARSIARLNGEVSEHLARERAGATDAANRGSRTRELAYLDAVLAQGRVLAARAEPGPVRTGVETDLQRIGERVGALRTRYAPPGPTPGTAPTSIQEPPGSGHARRGR